MNDTLLPTHVVQLRAPGEHPRTDLVEASRPLAALRAFAALTFAGCAVDTCAGFDGRHGAVMTATVRHEEGGEVTITTWRGYAMPLADVVAPVAEAAR